MWVMIMGYYVTYCLGIKLVIIAYTAVFLWVRFKLNTTWISVILVLFNTVL